MRSRAYLEDILYGRKRRPIVSLLLIVLSWIYGSIVRIRLACYAQGLFRKRRLPVPVISVGNITVGGTGKTPAVIAIAGLLRRNGRQPVILTRGYGRKDESAIEVLSGVADQPDRAGDEPALLAARLADVPVVVGRDRFRAGMVACERFLPDVAVLDDGFQHLRLERDLNIALIDAADPFGNGRLLPAGILREPAGGLRRADIVVITRSDRARDLDGLRSWIARRTAARIFTARHAPVVLVDIASGETRAVKSLRGTPVFAFAGIARPEALFTLLTSLGTVLKGSASYADHYRYTKDDLATLFQRTADSGAVMLLTTEKDGVKLRGMAPAGVWALRIDLEVLEKEAWEEVLLRLP